MPVTGTTNHIKEVVEDNDIEHIIIAIPSLNRKQINEIFEKCRETKAKTQIVPMLEDLLDGKVSVNEVRDVQVEDLLGREPIQLDDAGIGEQITGQTILVTGAGGSLDQKFAVK